jgi:hypothetical protein
MKVKLSENFRNRIFARTWTREECLLNSFVICAIVSTLSCLMLSQFRYTCSPLCISSYKSLKQKLSQHRIFWKYDDDIDNVMTLIMWWHWYWDDHKLTVENGSGSFDLKWFNRKASEQKPSNDILANFFGQMMFFLEKRFRQMIICWKNVLLKWSYVSRSNGYSVSQGFWIFCGS